MSAQLNKLTKLYTSTAVGLLMALSVSHPMLQGFAHFNVQGAAHAATTVKALPYDIGLAKAKAEGKWVMVKFEREDCVYCGQMTRETQANATTLQLLDKDFVWVQVDQKGQRKVKYGHTQITEAELSQRLKAWNYPYLLFLKPDGTPIGGLLGYQSPENMQLLLRYIESKAYETLRFEQFKQRQ